MPKRTLTLMLTLMLTLTHRPCPRLSVSSLVLFIPAEYPMARIYTGLLLSTLFLALLFAANPHASRMVSTVARLSQLTVVLVFVGCAAILECDDADACQQRFGIADAYSVSVLVLLASTGVLVAVLVLLVGTALHEVRAERERGHVLEAEEMEGLVRQMCGGGEHSLHGQLAGLLRHGATVKLTEALAAIKVELSSQAGASKFGAANHLKTGTIEDAILGLGHYMCTSTAASGSGSRIEQEWEDLIARVGEDDEAVEELQPFCRPWEKDWPPDLSVAREALVAEMAAWVRYIFHETCSEAAFHNGVRDLDRPADWTLASFVNHPVARQNRLSAEHVAALRIYTSHLFKYLNGPLRKTSIYGPGRKAHPLPLTMIALDEAIKRLRAEYVVTEKQRRAEGVAEIAGTRIRLYRGMKMLDVDDAFMAQRKGGTEIAPMSTTTDLSVAVHYGLGPSSLLFVLNVDNSMQMGADVQWISVFPAEAEVLSPLPSPPPKKEAGGGPQQAPSHPAPCRLVPHGCVTGGLPPAHLSAANRPCAEHSVWFKPLPSGGGVATHLLTS